MIGKLDICFNWKKDEWQGAMRSILLVDQLRMRALVIAIVVIGGLSA